MNYILLPLRDKEKLVYSIINKIDINKVLKHNWSVSHGYARTNLQDGTTISMHRLIMAVPSSTEIDHINHDKLDNRRENLRLATRSQNNINKNTKKNNKYRGVSQRSENSWRAYISVKGNKRHYIGGLKTAEEAARAYNRLAREYHGQFAVLNEVPDSI